MNQSDNDDSNLKDASANKKVGDSPDMIYNKPKSSLVQINSPASSKQVVRKLPEYRKLPFIQKKDDIQASTSSRIQTDTVQKTSPTTSRTSNYAFNFNAIKSRFNEPQSEPPQSKKRQFDGIKNDLSPTESKSPKKFGSKSSFLSSKNTNLVEDEFKNNQGLKQNNHKNLDTHTLQSDSKRQKSNSNTDISESPRTSNFINSEQVLTSESITPSATKNEQYISIIKTSAPENEQIIDMPEENASNQDSSHETTTSLKSSPYITTIQITNDNNSSPNEVLNNQDKIEASNAESATSNIVTESSEANTNTTAMNSSIANKKSDNTDIGSLSDDSDDDLSSITLHKSFIEQQKKEKEKKEEEQRKKEEAQATTSKSTNRPKVRDALTDTNDPCYWERVFETEYFKSKSLNFNDIVNREFGYAGRMGHGNRNNFFRGHSQTKTRLIYDQQLQNSREFVKKALSSLNNVRRMKQTHLLSEHDGCVNALNFNRSGTLMLSGSDDYRVCIWDWSKSKVVLQYDSGHKSNVFQTKFVPYTGDTQIVTCARDGQVRLGLISSSGTHFGTKRLLKHNDSCHKLAIEPDSSNLFLSCGEDGAVFEVDLRQRVPAKILSVKSHNRNYKLPLYSVHSNPTETYQFVVCGRDPYVRVYDKRMLVKEKTKVLKTFCPTHLKSSQRSSITSAVFNQSGTEIIASYSDDDIYLYEMNQEDDENPRYRYKGHRNSDTVKGVNYYGANDDFIVSGSDCGRIFFWEKTSQHVVQVLKSDDEQSGIVNVLEPHPSFPYLATSGLDSDIKIWSPVSEEPSNLENLAEIIRENQRIRETGRHFSLSSFEFELLLLLMQRPNNRVFVGSADNGSLSSRLNAVGVARTTDDSDTLFGPFNMRRRRGLLAGFEEEAREFSPVDDDDYEEQSFNEEDEEDEEENYMNFDDEEYDEEIDTRETDDYLNYFNQRPLLEESDTSNLTDNNNNNNNNNTSNESNNIVTNLPYLNSNQNNYNDSTDLNDID